MPRKAQLYRTTDQLRTAVVEHCRDRWREITGHDWTDDTRRFFLDDAPTPREAEARKVARELAAALRAVQRFVDSAPRDAPASGVEWALTATLREMNRTPHLRDWAGDALDVGRLERVANAGKGSKPTTGLIVERSRWWIYRAEADEILERDRERMRIPMDALRRAERDGDHLAAARAEADYRKASADYQATMRPLGRNERAVAAILCGHPFDVRASDLKNPVSKIVETVAQRLATEARRQESEATTALEAARGREAKDLQRTPEARERAPVSSTAALTTKKGPSVH